MNKELNKTAPMLIDPETFMLQLVTTLKLPIVHAVLKHSPCDDTMEANITFLVSQILAKSAIGESRPQDISKWASSIIKSFDDEVLENELDSLKDDLEDTLMAFSSINASSILQSILKGDLHA